MAVLNGKTISERKPGMDQLPLRIAGLAGTFLIYIGMIFPSAAWMEGLRWFAFPVFAFLISEGYEYSSSRRLYARRLFLFALISEIPYDLLVNGHIPYYDAQNVLFTLLLGLGCIAALDFVREKLENTFVTLLAAVLLHWIAYNLGKAFGFEMYAVGVAIMLLFNISGHVTYTKLLQFAFIMYMAYRDYAAVLMQPSSETLYIPAPLFALAGLILIWIYNGERGLNTLASRYIFYAIYPVMLFICWIIKLIA